jgi:ribosomal protein L29
MSDNFVDQLKKTIIEQKSALAALESGKLQVGGPDETLAKIIALRRSIAKYQSQIDFNNTNRHPIR